MSSFGETLRQARLDKGVTLREAEQVTHIRRRYLQALENEDAAALPAPVYARGMIRAYARYLGLPPESMVDLFYGAGRKEEKLYVQSWQGGGLAWHFSPRLLAFIGAVLLALILLGLGWTQYSSWAESLARVEQRQAGRVAATSTAVAVQASPAPTRLPAGLPTATATPQPPPTPAPTPVEGVVVEVRLVAATWLDVSVDGQRVLSENLPAGATRSFNGQRSIRLVAANGAAVEVTENGQPRGMLDAGGRAVEARWTR